MNGLEALKELGSNYASVDTSNTIEDEYYREYEIIEKELKDGEKNKKVLEIINKKTYLDFISIREADNYDEYIEHFAECVQKLLKRGEVLNFAVTRDEFDLLKEVLK